MLAKHLLAAAGNAAEQLYVDDVFSTWLYAGNGGTQTVTNGVNLSGEGGMVWFKNRSSVTDHYLVSSELNNFNTQLQSNTTNGGSSGFPFTSAVDGFSINTAGAAQLGQIGDNYASWTFRKARKFFDIVTYTGNATNRTISHNLGIEPGMILIKQTSGAADWIVNHRGLTSLGGGQYLVLNTTAAAVTASNVFNNTNATDTGFTLGTSSLVNQGGATYIAYLFATDTAAEGFIQCGSFTSDGSGNATVTLGWEPQYVLFKRTDSTSDWFVGDTLRGLNAGSLGTALRANTSAAESFVDIGFAITATGFSYSSVSSATYVYIAIRRPNKPPTVGAEVFAPVARTGTGSAGTSTAFGQVTDLVFTKARSSTETWAWTDRLRGATLEVSSANPGSDTVFANDVTGFDTMTGFRFGTGASGRINTNATTYIDNLFRRAPGFFDVVCYTGNGATLSVSHSLSAAPEIIFVRRRDTGVNWGVLFASTPTYLVLNSDIAANAAALQFYFGNGTSYVAPTSSAFTVGNSDSSTNANGGTYVAYLFATLAGISKVGSYTGNGSNQTINCGFTTGARFVLIKRTDSTGDWYVWDSARGIVAGNDPHLSLNTTAAEVTTDDSVDTDTSGFIVNQDAATNVNVNAASYVFFAVS